jgi:serine/threonine-protein kinase
MSPPSQLGRYERLAPIAAGGMASVWAARLRGPAGFNKVVAIKSLLPDLASEPEYRTMFLDEARVASRLHHPNLCETFDVGEENGEWFIVMEWVDGVSLYRLLKPARSGAVALPFDLAARIVAEACAGLHAAHEATDDDGSPLAVVHRDVSPQNVLVSADGHVKVTDFGVAKARGKSHATCAGQAKGKLAYMAPEQLRSAPLDRRVDVFSLGSMLYEITTGQKPFEGDSEMIVARAILEREPARPSAVVAGYPAELERIVLRAMSKDPNTRFSSAEGLRLALEHWMSKSGRPATSRDVAALVRERCGGEIASRRADIERALRAPPPLPPLAVPEEPTRATPSWSQRAVLVLGALVVVTGIGSLAWSGTRKPEVAEEVEPPTTTSAPVAAIVTAEVKRPKTDERETRSVAVHVNAPQGQLLIDGEPAEVDEDGRAKIERPDAGGVHVGIAKAPGYIDRLFVIDDSTPSSVDVLLTPTELTPLPNR